MAESIESKFRRFWAAMQTSASVMGANEHQRNALRSLFRIAFYAGFGSMLSQLKPPFPTGEELGAWSAELEKEIGSDKGYEERN